MITIKPERAEREKNVHHFRHHHKNKSCRIFNNFLSFLCNRKTRQREAPKHSASLHERKKTLKFMCFASEAQNDTMHTQGTAREMRTESFALRGEIQPSENDE